MLANIGTAIVASNQNELIHLKIEFFRLSLYRVIH